MPILACKRVHYFSQGDETAFFEWVGRISCVTRFEGAGDTLYLHVRGARIADRDLRELVALFHRYHVPMKQLAQFENPGNRTWFARHGMYWFARVWGGDGAHKIARKPRVPKHAAAERERRTQR